MNKLISIIFIIIIARQIAGAQTKLELNIEKWKNYTYYNEFFNDDLSSGFYYDSCSYCGIFGTNRTKINMRFNSILKKSGERYEVKGKDILKGKICSFVGNLVIERLEIVYLDENNDEALLLAVGKYNFVENGSTKGSGVFFGSFRKYIMYSWKNHKFFPADGYTERGSEEGFAGFWKNSSNNSTYECHFGFERYPEDIAGDFDIGDGEPIINPKYKEYGWNSNFEMNGENEWGYYWSLDCSKWW